MGWPTAEFFVDVIFRRRTRCKSFGKFSLVLLAGFTLQGRCPARALTLLCGKLRVSLKKGDVNKKFRRGRGTCRLCRRDPELHTLVYLLLVLHVCMQRESLVQVQRYAASGRLHQSISTDDLIA